MINKFRNQLLIILSAVLASLLILAGAFMLLPEKKAHAAGDLYWGIDGGGVLTLSGSSSDVTPYNYSDATWSVFKSNITSVTVAGYAYAPQSTLYWFNGCTALTNVDFTGLDTSGVTNMGDMFNGCSGLKSLDLSSFNTAKVMAMNGMFNGCSGLTSLTLPASFNTANVTNMNGMFQNCSSLTSLNLSSFNTANVTAMDNIFNGCSKLESLDLSSFDTTKVRAQDVFTGCRSLMEIKTPAQVGSVSFKLRCRFWDGTKDITSITSADANKTIYAHHSYDTNGVCTYCNYATSFEVTQNNIKNYYGSGAQAFNAANSSGMATVKMLADAESSSTLTVEAGKNITLDLNGYKLTHTGSGEVICVLGTLTVNDSNKNKTNTVTYYTSATETSTVPLSGGVITGGKNAGVVIGDDDTAGTLILNGGNISGNIPSGENSGGGLYVSRESMVTLYGGTVSYNYSNMYGGGIRLNGATLNIGTADKESTAEISHNTAYSAAGAIDERAIYLSTIYMNGGKISYNTAVTGEIGGMSLEANTLLTIDKGEISYNTAATHGGGICVLTTRENAVITMNNAVIKNNTAGTEGGGLCIDSQSVTVHMNGCTVSDNSAAYGGGVCVNGGTFEVSGAVNITGNTSSGAANNVYFGSGDITITVTDALTEGAQIGISNTGAVATGFTYGNPENYFIPDNSANNCVYASNDGTVTIGTHTGGTATCTAKAECEHCGNEYGDLAVNNHSWNMDEWASNETNHWRPCSYNCTNRYNVGEHSFNENGECTICGYTAYFKVTQNGTVNHYKTITEAFAAVENTATVTMYADAEISQTLIVEEKKTITLNLNGCMLKRTGSTGSVIKVIGGGSLTLTDANNDTSKKHTITDPNDTSKTIEIIGGLITGGKGYFDEYGFSYGGGVYVGGTFIMNGGTIAGNTARNGGGVYCNGIFEMTGGKISYNTASAYGGGVRVESRATFKLSGAPIITGNKKGAKDNNIDLFDGKIITVTGELTEGAKIGVSNTGVIATGFMQGGKPSQYFIHVDPANDCIYISDEKEGEVTIGTHDFTVWAYDETNHWHVCADCGETQGDETAHSGTDDGDCTTAVVCICGYEITAAETEHNYVNCECTHCEAKAYFEVSVGENDKSYYTTIGAAWSAAHTKANESGAATVTMYTDAEISQTLVVAANITLDLNGHMLKQTSNHYVIDVYYGTFTLEDNGSGSHTIISPVTNAEVTIDGGVITGGNAVIGCVTVEYGAEFEMSGGTIAGNTARNGGGVYCNGIFEMTGGTISNNTANGVGGGVYVAGGTFEMSGGTISGNTAASWGGGVMVRGAFKMTGGTISGNTANAIGDGVYVDSDYGGTFEVSGAVNIMGNGTQNVELYFCSLTVTGPLTDPDDPTLKAQIGVTPVIDSDTGATAGTVATGFTGANNPDNKKPSEYFIIDDNSYNQSQHFNCIYANDGTVSFGTHTGGTATCTQKAECENCGTEFGDFGGHSYSEEWSSDADGHWHECNNGCGTKQDEDTHTFTDGECTICGYTAYFKVTQNGTVNHYKTITEAFAAVENTATVTMYADAEISQTFNILAGNNITLDLNGCMLKRTGSGCVITVNGTFTLEDNGDGSTPHTILSPVTNEEVTIDGGLITGGTAYGVVVRKNGMFTMTGGTIGGNTGGRGGGVYTYGTFIMTGGTISHNKSDVIGGGVSMDSESSSTYNVGTFTMAGGTISGNRANYGGGVYVYSGSFSVSGAAKITGNKSKDGSSDNNVGLRDGVPKITVMGELTDGAKIGVHNTGTVITGYTQTDKPSNYFIPDNTANNCIYISDKENGTITVGTHDIVYYEAKEPTCTEEGWEAYEGCSHCDYAIEKVELPALGHSFGEWNEESPATCESTGTKGYKDCLLCNKHFASDGETEIIDLTIPALGHEWGDGEETTAPACTADGEKTFTCANDSSHTKTEVIPAFGHTEVIDEGVAATCTEMGKTDGKHCSVCNEVIVAQTEIPALGHDVTQHEGQAATCTEAGWEAYEDCSRCDYSTKDEIPATGHSLTHNPETDATEEKEGNTEYWECDHCHKYFADEDGKTEITEKSSVIIAKIQSGNSSVIWIILIIILCIIIAGEVAFITYRKVRQAKDKESR